MPIFNLGKRRESLTGSAEAYKIKVIGYLEARGFYLHQDSFVEGTLPDAILIRKNEDREYWLEAKATTVSLKNANFVKEMANYLRFYLTRSPTNRFKMIFVIKDYHNPSLFESIYDKIDEEEIQNYLIYILERVDDL